MRIFVVASPHIGSPWKCNTQGMFGVLKILFFYNLIVIKVAEGATYKTLITW